MRYTNVIVDVISSLRKKGMLNSAYVLSSFLSKYAQEVADLDTADATAPAAPGEDPLKDLEEDAISLGGQEPPEAATETAIPESTVPSEQAVLQRVLFYQFNKWHSILDRELPKFDYLGEENIDAIRSSLANVHKTMSQVMQNNKSEIDKEIISKWDGEIQKVLFKIRQSQKAKINETKAKVDAFLLYGTTNLLYKKFERLCENDSAFAAVKVEFEGLMNVFANVIKNVSEEIAKTDLTEMR